MGLLQGQAPHRPQPCLETSVVDLNPAFGEQLLDIAVGEPEA
jgi:hypothetical protein